MRIGLHKDEDIGPLLDRPAGGRAGSTPPHPLRGSPHGIRRRLPGLTQTSRAPGKATGKGREARALLLSALSFYYLLFSFLFLF